MDVTINGTGPNSNIEAQVDPSFQASRTNLRPLEFTGQGLIGGHFYVSATFSNTAGGPAAGSQIFSVRWRDTRMLMVLKRIFCSAATTTAFTTAQAVDLQVIKATSFPNNPSANGTNVAPSMTSQKARSATMSTSLLFANAGDVQISNGAALTAGASQVLDTQPFGYSAVLASTAVGTIGTVALYELRDFGVHPFVFGPNEGFVIQNGIALGAAGVVKFGFTLEYAEVPAY